MDTLCVRLTMQPQHEPIQNFYKYSNDHSKEKSHEKQYNDISRLSFSVTACIRIQQHLSRFRKKPEKQGHMWSFAQVFGSKLLLTVSTQHFSFVVAMRLHVDNTNKAGDYLRTSKSRCCLLTHSRLRWSSAQHSQ